jgi:hypothetical protein
MCDPCCIIVGCKAYPTKVETPEGFPPPPRKVFCTRCGGIGPGEYKRDYYSLCICFIPCCCPCGRSDPYLSCSLCHSNLSSVGTFECHSCGTTTTFRSQNCPACGTRKGSDGDGGYRRLDLQQ